MTYMEGMAVKVERATLAMGVAIQSRKVTQVSETLAKVEID